MFNLKVTVIRADLRHRLAWAVIAIHATLASTAAAQPTSVDQPVQIERIGHLIQQLNSQRFSEREQAVEALSQLGTLAVRPLAKGFADAPPEAMWRTLIVLEQIAVEGDEATFYRVAALIKLLSADRDVTVKLHAIHRRWIAQQTERASAFLQSRGALVTLATDPVVGQPDEAVVLWALQNIEDGWPGGATVEPEAAEQKSRSPRQTLPVNSAPLSNRIDQVLVASLDQNRQFVFGSQASPALRNSADPVIQHAQGRMLQVGGGLVMLADGRMAFSEYDYGGSRVDFDHRWQSGLAEFETLRQIGDLRTVQFKSFKIMPGHLDVLGQIESLRSVSWIACDVDMAAWSGLAGLKDIEQLTVDSIKLDDRAVSGMAKMPNLRTLRLASTPFGRSALKPLGDAPALTTLILENVQLTAEYMEVIAAHRGLRQVQLTNCRFPYSEYQRLFSNRAELNLQVSGNAFLGIRGAGNLGGNVLGSCQVSEVVPGTAAEAAGLQVGDAILQIDDKKLESFQDLMAAISQYQPGDKITLTIRRGSTNMNLEAALGARN